MKLYKIAAIFILTQAILMELSVFTLGWILLIFSIDPVSFSRHFSFGFDYLSENMVSFMMLAGVFGSLRLVGAIGLLKNRMWGLALSIIMIVVTLVIMVFMLPAGVVDGILSGAALLLILFAYFDKKPIK